MSILKPTDLDSALWNRLMDLRDRRIGTTDDERRGEEILPVKLKDEELLQMGKANAQACSQIAQMERDLEHAKKRVKADIEGLEAQLQMNNECINTGRQDRTVEVVSLLDYPKRGQKSTFRLDTFEIVRQSTMSQEETQRVMKLEEARESGRPSPLPTRPKKDKGKNKKEPHWNGYLVVVKGGALFAGEVLPPDEAERCAHLNGFDNAATMIASLPPEAATELEPAPAEPAPAPDGLLVEAAEAAAPAESGTPEAEHALPPIGGETPAD